jgi:folate-binding protein YgfZ
MDGLAEQLARALSHGGAYALPPRSIIRLTGADAFRYLNGQITKDLGRVEDGHWIPACILTPKGKLCALLQVCRQGGEVLLECDPVVEGELLARLGRTIVADDVELSAEPAPPAIHLFGAAAEPLAPGSRIISRMGVPGYDLPAGDPKVDPQTPQLLDPLVVETVRILRGIPIWGSELDSGTLPPEAGLDGTSIDYDRGCYPGQEVISRLRSIGRVNRLLTGFAAAEVGQSLAAGMVIVTADGSLPGREERITSAVQPPDGSPALALGYLPRGATGPFFALDPLTGSKTPLSIIAIHGT